jgi:hypothetical protein
MTKVTVNSGNCGFSVVVKVQKGQGKEVCVSIETECEMVMKMLKDISLISMKNLFTNHANNPVYRSAGKYLEHPACPVPVAILKAAEVELGLCLPGDITIKFKNKDEKPGRI